MDRRCESLCLDWSGLPGLPGPGVRRIQPGVSVSCPLCDWAPQTGCVNTWGRRAARPPPPPALFRHTLPLPLPVPPPTPALLSVPGSHPHNAYLIVLTSSGGGISPMVTSMKSTRESVQCGWLIYSSFILNIVQALLTWGNNWAVITLEGHSNHVS